MAKLPLYLPNHFHAYDIDNCRWDEGAQMYRVTVDGQDYQSYPTSEKIREIAQNRRRDAYAYEAMARCAEARENRQEAEAERDRIRAEVMAEVGYISTDKEGYQALGRNDPNAQRLVDIAVEARLKLEEQA